MLRPLVLTLALFQVCALLASAQAPDIPEPGSVEAIATATGDRHFLSPWVSYLPKSTVVPSPLAFLGRITGAPGEFVDSAKAYAYCRALTASPRVRVFTIGRSEEGRDIILLAIADEAGIRDLDRLKAATSALANPRGTDQAAADRLIQSARPIYYFNAALHSDETGSTEAMLEMAYRLAASEQPMIRRIREQLVVLINPVSNPDGRDKMVQWFYRYLKGKTDRATLPRQSPPYWSKYTFVDINRDTHQQTHETIKAVHGMFQQLVTSPALLYSSPMLLQDTLEEGRVAADRALERLIPGEDQHPVSIHKAMRHSVFAGGKRLRPILCREAGRMVGGVLPEGIDELGAAVEMLHTYSLIHDDLPALDNDDLRRGRPTCHVAFGEAIAILAGDALQTQAYEVLARLQCPAEARVRIIEEIAHGTGTIDGMIGGQVVDLEAEHSRPDVKMLEYIHRAKTAALITASLVSGGIYSGGKDGEITSLRSFGQQIGLAFQIVDDVLDVTQTSEQLGKTAGKDTAAEKATYPALFGVDESLKKADALVRGAFAELDTFGPPSEILKDLARYLVERKK